MFLQIVRGRFYHNTICVGKRGTISKSEEINLNEEFLNIPSIIRGETSDGCLGGS
jgi:hypothetical protein